MSKKLWIKAHDQLERQALEAGLTEEEAEVYADGLADEISQELASVTYDLSS